MLDAEVVIAKDNDTSAEIRHVTDRAAVKPDQFVEFVVPVDDSRTRRNPSLRDTVPRISELTIRLDSYPGLPGVKVTRDTAPAHAEVRGHVRRYDPGTGKLTVSTGKKTVTGVLVEDAVATVRSSDIRLVRRKVIESPYTGRPHAR